ncbi:MotA/TolQ/ExbB proton channel family protein [Paraburkholderia sp. CNPSo 3076]|uniref:motility-associated protein n=1 Tax=Paraburkholderia sp. CNPSo 3076 TaxID=2940936 RepID=UPI00224E8D24|nr:motility-associated protein [Paraburkholderia sp. CNPSo 3076]MCX5545187.1 MotA/TolQ/ExbB proton channel family protein [Paraburkholderia sp. CNPSo 3076]
MFVAIGWIVVLGSVIGSFVGVGGHLPALVQPFELLCIFGAALGAFVVSNPTATLGKTLKALPTCFKGGGYTKAQYLELIALLYELPDLMDEELDTHHSEVSIAPNAIQKMADGLPAFGIVAAVMGVVHTMGSVGKPPAVLGEMIAGALVGTFLGILLAYGFVGPIADLLTAKGRAASKPFQCAKAVLLASLAGYAPPVAVEFGRKVLFTADRPSFQELDEAVRATRAPKAA